MYLDNHPFVAAIVSIGLTLLGIGIGKDVHLQVAPHLLDVGLPLWIKDCFQIFAWCGAGITGMVAGHGFWMNTIVPKVKSWKQKRKSRKK